MATYKYAIEFSDEETANYFVCTREYSQEYAWQDIWEDIVSSGDLQMTFELLEVEEDEEE
jgi:hypothetical protein